MHDKYVNKISAVVFVARTPQRGESVAGSLESSVVGLRVCARQRIYLFQCQSARECGECAVAAAAGSIYAKGLSVVSQQADERKDGDKRLLQQGRKFPFIDYLLRLILVGISNSFDKMFALSTSLWR